MRQEVTIAGGGLAGLSLGIALRDRGVPVVLHEAGSYPRHRVCGEFINGVQKETLAALGIDDLLAGGLRLESTVWVVGNEVVLRDTLPEPAIGISRHALDEQLARRLAERGGRVAERSRERPSDREGLVWAVGRQPERGSEWLGLKVHAKSMETLADLEMHLGKAGYVGTARIEDGRVNICGLFQRQAGVRGKGAHLLEGYLTANGMDALLDRLTVADLDEASFTGVSAFRLGRQVEDGLCRVGDAESIIPPFTGNGMSMALEAAESAIEPLREFAEGRLGWGGVVETLRARLKKRFAKRLNTARLLHPLLFSRFGRHLLASGARSGALPFHFLFRTLR